MTVSIETLVCAVRGHVTPAATVGALDPADAGFGIDVHPTWRISRCLRCGSWIGGPPPDQPERERIAPFEELDLPRRGKPLRQAVILRIISVERAVHSVIFALIAGLALLLRSHLAGAQSTVHQYLDNLARTEQQTGRVNNNSVLSREGAKFLHLKSSTLEVLIITAAIYAVVEGTEAVGLWYEKRWAEYLTALATAGFIPFEIRELTKKVSIVRVGAFVVNLAIIVYLVYAKHLFGVGRKKAEAAAQAEALDRSAFPPPF